MADLVWLRHELTGLAARFHPDSVEHWRLNGWHQCDPPAEPDPTREAPPQGAVSVSGAEPDPPVKPAAKSRTSK